MTETRQHGRRRAEPARKSFIFSAAPASNEAPVSRRATPVTATAKGLAAVAVVGALLGAGAVAQQTVAPSGTLDSKSQANLLSASETTAPVSAPSDAAITFADPAISSTTSAKPTTAPLQAAAGSVTPASSTPPAPVDDPAAAKAFAAGELASFGWGADQMQCLSLLWQRESEWLTSAENASSGAYGIAQSLPAEKMASTGTDWATNHETQIRWGLDYISGRYGSPCGAWGHSESVGWY